MCNLIPSILVKEGADLGFINICYNSSQKLDIYGLFAGHSVFVTVYHPLKAIEPKQVTGQAAFKLNAIGKLVERVPSKDCKTVESNLYSVKLAQEDYEIW